MTNENIFPYLSHIKFFSKQASVSVTILMELVSGGSFWKILSRHVISYETYSSQNARTLDLKACSL